MTSDEILTVIKEATGTFGNISVKPTNYGMSIMVKTILPILLKIPYDQVEAAHNLSGLIAPSAKYTTKYGTSFKLPTRPHHYCQTITATMSGTDQRKAEATHSSHK